MRVRTPHRATYERQSSEVVDFDFVTGWTTAKALKLRSEPLAPRSLNAILSTIPSARKRFTWEQPTTLQNGDRILYEGTYYYLHDVIRDDERGRWPYYTGIGALQFHHV